MTNLELRHECLDIIVEELDKVDLTLQTRLWIADNCFDAIFDTSYTSEAMMKDIVRELQNKGNETGGFRLVIDRGAPPAEASAKAIKDDSIFLAQVVTGNAVVEPIPSRGSFYRQSYTLALKNGMVYNIGRGVTPVIPGVLRENHIAIKNADDETDPSLREVNSYVSRDHADIRVVNGSFYLHSTKIGRTKIIRDEPGYGQRVIRIMNDMTFEQLKDNDIIVLGSMFMMRFRLCK